MTRTARPTLTSSELIQLSKEELIAHRKYLHRVRKTTDWRSRAYAAQHDIGRINQELLRRRSIAT